MTPTPRGIGAMEVPLEPVRWKDGAVRLIDQRLLPGELRHWRCETVEEVARAIRTLAVRGAPAIGIAAAYGVALGAFRAREQGKPVETTAREAVVLLGATRPTAVNLFYALRRMDRVLAEGGSPGELPDRLLGEADRILSEDLDTGRRIAEAGCAVFPVGEPLRVLTHCNAGGLATGGWGTALAPVYLAAGLGRQVSVLADETRPLFQGRRLTAWELARAGIPVRILVDGAAASVLARGDVDVVIVGADRIAANGDVANKIGTYPLALGAREAEIPFYVAAPLSTFDTSTPTGKEIPMEERSAEEVLGEASPEGVGALNPAFDITPARLITGWITERGVLHPPFPPEDQETGAVSEAP
jgi:methylthioribose-1-phosphate isomerase